jgi:hypothetical protein
VREPRASALPADPRTVACYLTDAATRHRATTLDLHLAAIAYAHLAAGFPIPTTHQAVREVRTGVRPTHGAAARGKAAPMTEDRGPAPPCEPARRLAGRPARSSAVADRLRLL